MFNFNLTEKFNQIKDAAMNFKNRDFMQGVVAGCFWVSSADGDINADEINKLNQTLKAIPEFATFGKELDDTIATFRSLFTDNVEVGIAKARKELSEVSGDSNKELTYAVCTAIAKADGVVDEQEKAVLTQIAQILNVNPSLYL